MVPHKFNKGNRNPMKTIRSERLSLAYKAPLAGLRIMFGVNLIFWSSIQSESKQVRAFRVGWF